MALTSEQMITIANELVNGKKPSIAGKEAEAFRAKIGPEIEEIKKKGGQVDIPSEWSVS